MVGLAKPTPLRPGEAPTTRAHIPAQSGDERLVPPPSESAPSETIV